MADVAFFREDDLKLMVIQITGTLTVPEVMTAIEQFYSNHPTQRLLVDFSEADVGDITNEWLRRLTKTIAQQAHARRGGLSAFVLKSDLAYGMGRMLAAFYQLEKVPVSAECFRTRPDALKWLGCPPETELPQSSEKNSSTP